MSSLDTDVLTDVLSLMSQMAGDWEYDGEIGPKTLLLAELGLESLDLVVLGTMIQQRYGRLPFAEYLAEIGQHPLEERDISVADLVQFVSDHATKRVGGGAR